MKIEYQDNHGHSFDISLSLKLIFFYFVSFVEVAFVTNYPYNDFFQTEMTASKCTYTFLVKEGVDYEHELEPFYLNTKSNVIEQVSPSSRTTPRQNKKPFGPISEVYQVDEKIIKIVNKDQEGVLLFVDRLSPLMDKEDTRMKETLIRLKDESTSVLVQTLNDIITGFHSFEFKRKVPLKRQETLPSSSLSSGLNDSTFSTEVESTPTSSRRISVKLSFDGSTFGQNPTVSKRRLQVEEVERYASAKNAKKCGAEDEHEKVSGDGESEEEEQENIDIMAYAEQVIKAARYRGIDSEKLEVASCLRIDHLKVERLKKLISSTPDKTMTWCGAIVVLEDGKVVSPYYVYVNPEIFLAMKQLQGEGRLVTDKVPVAVHYVDKDDAVDQETLGMFLNTNSKNFSEQLHDKMTYQDILRFCCFTVGNETDRNPDGIKEFIKNTLKGLPKGDPNLTMFLKYAGLPMEYMNKFETFMHQYETGSLASQNLSLRKIRNMDRNGVRKLHAS